MQLEPQVYAVVNDALQVLHALRNARFSRANKYLDTIKSTLIEQHYTSQMRRTVYGVFSDLGSVLNLSTNKLI